MTARIRFMAVPAAVLLLVSPVLWSVAAQAASPNAPAAKGKAGALAATPPAGRTKPSASRRPASFTRQMPLREAIDILRSSTTPPLNLIVLWRALQSAGIDENTPIGIDGVPGLRVGRYLDLLTLSLSAGASAKIDYVVHRGVITISTADTLPAPKPIPRVYDISDLAAPPARYAPATMGFGMGYGVLTPPPGGYAQNPTNSFYATGSSFSSPGNTPGNVRPYLPR